MSDSLAAVQRSSSDREGLSPSPEASSPEVVTMADLLVEDDDDNGTEPSTDRSETMDETMEDDDENDDEYVGMG